MYILPCMCLCQMRRQRTHCPMRVCNVRTEGYAAHDRRDDEKSHQVPLLGDRIRSDDVVAHRDERTVSEERNEHEHQDRQLEEGGPLVAFFDLIFDVFSLCVLPKWFSCHVEPAHLEQMRERQGGREGRGG